MNDETKDKVNLFSSSPTGGRTMHAHDEPPAMSFQPGATFTPGSQAKPTQVHDSPTAAAEAPSNISSKLDDMIARTDDAPVRSTARTGDAILDEIKASELNRASASQPAMDIVKKSPSIDPRPLDKPATLKSITDEAKSDQSPQIKSDDVIKEELTKTYSENREETKPDMAVKPEATDKPLIHDDNEAKGAQLDEEGTTAIKLKNVNVAGTTLSQPTSQAAAEPNKQHDFPNESHLAGLPAITSSSRADHQASALAKAKPTGKQGLKYALAAVAATLVIGVGGAMAYTPARTQITALITGKKAASVNTNTPQPSPTPQTEQKSDANYSVSDYLKNMSGPKDGTNSSGATGFDFKNKASYAQDSSKATASKKLTAGNIPTAVAPPVVGSLFPVVPPSQVVNDYVGLDSPCFETVLPKDNQPFYNDWCIFGANYGAQLVSNLQVIPYTAADKANFDQVINYFKSNLDPTVKLSSDSTITVGGVSARKLVFTGSQSAQSFPDIMVMVDFGKDRYTHDTLNAHGFLIAGSYNDDFSKKSFDTALAHWNWK